MTYQQGKRWGVRRPTMRNGYEMQWCADRHKYVYSHRLAMEKHLGRFLQAQEVVHHINHDKLDNRLENLQLTTHAEHRRIHGFDYLRGPRPWQETPKQPCPVCGEMFKPWSRQGRRTVTCSVSCSNRYRARKTA